MSKALIIGGAFIVTIVGAAPFAADKIISKEVIAGIESAKTEVMAQDPTATITYGSVSYSIFDDLVTIKDLNVHSAGSGIEINLGKLVFNEDAGKVSSTLPENAVSIIENGTIKFRTAGFNEKEKDILSFLSGSDEFIDFSLKMSGKFDEASKKYKYESNIYVENIGTTEIDFDIEGIDPNSDEVKALTQQNAMAYMTENVALNGFSIAFTTQNTQGIMDKLVGIKKFVKSDEQLKVEFDKLAAKMESDEALSGFAKPIKDLSTSYFSNSEVKFTLLSEKRITAKVMMSLAMASQAGGTNPQNIADHLGVKLISELR